MGGLVQVLVVVAEGNPTVMKVANTGARAGSSPGARLIKLYNS